MAQPTNDGPPESVTFQQFKGLKNTVTAERLAPDELQTATNVDIDDVGQLHRRRGYTRRINGDFHSIYTTLAGKVFGVKDGALGVISPGWDFSPIQSGVSPDALAYTEVGEDLYFSSRTSSGVVHADHSVSSWGVPVSAPDWLSPVVNMTDTLGAIRGKLISPPPMATALAYHNGRIYMAVEKTVWATELYLYNYVDRTRGFLPYEADVTLIGSVGDGIYIGTSTGVWFMSGPFGEMRRTQVLDTGALPGSLVLVPAEMVHPQARNGQPYPEGTALVFMTATGVHAAFERGACFNITQGQMMFPVAESVAAMYRDQDGVHQYVGVADSRGSPTSAARIGDYVDAEIRRFQP